MVIENKYLRKAIEKTKYIVLVKRYIIDMPGSSLVYVSPNASEIGMNVEMLNKGMKLSEDYIYPSDREMVMKTIHNAIDNRVQDYVHTNIVWLETMGCFDRCGSISVSKLCRKKKIHMK